MTLYANTHCSVVAGGAVTQTGQFRDLIAPTSTLSGGTDDTYAKTRWGIYPHSSHTPSATHKLSAVSPTYDSGDDKVYVTELAAKPLSDLKAEKTDAIKAKVFGSDGLIETGFRYTLPGSLADWHTYQIDETSQVNMTSVGGLFALDVADAHGGFWRDADNVNVVMTQAECIAFFAAAAAYKAVIVRRMWQLIVAANAAADSAALDLINVSAGSIDGAGGWPANGS
jgi:hypothetical protein